MRISTGMLFDAGVHSINRQTSSLLHLQQQLSSGRRVLNPSDDPVAAARVLEVTQSQNVIAQLTVNHNNATSALGLEEAQLTGATEIMARVRELTVQAGNTTLSASDRKALAFEMRARFDELMGIANSKDGAGQYIFSGYKGATKPFGGSVEEILNGGTIQYSGDEGQRRLQISPSRYLEVSDSGSDVFQRVRNGNGYFVTGYPTDSVTNKIENKGTGIIDGGTIVDPAKWAAAAGEYSIKFYTDASTPPVTYYDLLNSSGNSVIGATATYPPTKDLGNPPLTLPSTTHAAGGQRIYRSGEPIVLGPITGDLAVAPDLGSKVEIKGEPYGGNSTLGWEDGDIFTIKPSSTQGVFDTIAKVIGALEKPIEMADVGELNGVQAQNWVSSGIARLSMDISFALSDLDQSTENILRVRAAVGSHMNEIESISSVNADVTLQYQQTLSELQDLDYARAITDLTRKQTDLQAAQQSFAIVSKLSLFNYI